jgi:hypothetical protein
MLLMNIQPAWYANQCQVSTNAKCANVEQVVMIRAQANQIIWRIWTIVRSFRAGGHVLPPGVWSAIARKRASLGR